MMAGAGAEMENADDTEISKIFQVKCTSCYLLLELVTWYKIKLDVKGEGHAGDDPN